MSALLGKAGKRLFEQHLEQYSPQDPLYEFYINDRGKKKRRKVSAMAIISHISSPTQRAPPPGLSSRDAKILKSVQRRAHYLDKGFRILCFRFGWTFAIGLIPVVGNIADISLNYLLVVRKARQAEIPSWLLSRMLMNNAISAGVGFVPVVGDIILAVYKANSRNAALLEEFLRIRGDSFLKIQEQESASQGLQTGALGGVSEVDAEQVKPGAGISKGEVVPTANNVDSD